MDPRIQYARTSDGLSIAYYAIGSGPPLVSLSPSISHSIEREWGIPSMRAIAEFSARALTYVRFDPRGIGLSSRYDGPFTIDALMLDVEAVVDAVAPGQPVNLNAPGGFGPVGIAYAAAHPDRVSRLVLWSAAASGAEIDSEPLRRVRALAEVDIELGSEAMAQAMDGFENAEVAHQFAQMMRETDREPWLRFETARLTWDVTPLLAHVQAPTLVIHPKRHRYFPVANAQRIAEGIKGAQLALIDSASVLATGRESTLVVAAFLRGGAETDTPPAGSQTVTILFTDIVDSTKITERIGDSLFRDRSSALEARLRQLIEREHGRAVDGRTLGDGVLATFRSAQDAIAAARRCTNAGNELDLPLHVGLHVGDVIRDSENVYGGAVNIAARVCGLSAPGEILVTGTVRELARTSAGVTFEDRGEQMLKGIDDPVRVFTVR